MSHELESHFEKESTLQAFQLARRAVELDPGYARAWLVLGWTCWQIALEKWADDLENYVSLGPRGFHQGRGP